MNESNEPSYYEIALTNRQVLIAFVVILGSLLASFLSGVWIGRKDATSGPTNETSIAALEEDEPNSGIDPLGFFANENEVQGDKPDLSPILGEQPAGERTLAEEVGSAPPPTRRENPPPQPQEQPRQTPPRPSPPPPVATPPPPEPARETTPPPPPPPKRDPPPPAQIAAPQEGFVIQVFSTRDEPQARKVLKQLRDGGFSAFMSPVQVENQAMYRVRVGPFDKRAEADKQAVQVKSRFRLDTWVTAASN